MTELAITPTPAYAVAGAQISDMEQLHNAERIVRADAPTLYPSEDIGLKSIDANGTTCRVGSELGIPSDENSEDHVAILQFTRTDGQSVFALQGLVPAVDEHGVTSHYKADTPLQVIGPRGLALGRQADNESKRSQDASLLSAEALWGSGKTFGDDASGRHVKITQTHDFLTISDTSTNGTYVLGGEMVASILPGSGHIAEHTSLAKSVAEVSGLFVDGKFAGRDIITRDTTMGGKNPEATVDIRSWQAGAEAIVVDANNDPEMYGALRTTFVDMLKQSNKKLKHVSESEAVGAIYKAVSATLSYDLEYVDTLSAEMSQEDAAHRKIDLGYYLGEGKGVCRHMALAAAWLGGEAAEMGLLPGRLTAEVNQRTADNAAHEWARYTSPSGQVFIIDPAQKFVGKLEDSIGSKRWEYFRNGEQAEYIRALGSVVNSQVDFKAKPKADNKLRQLFKRS